MDRASDWLTANLVRVIYIDKVQSFQREDEQGMI